MLWGGLGMMAAVVMLLVSVSRLSAEIAAVLGGAGFGVFIDELGKVISRDNDYFFRPTVALIYVIFVVLVLVFRRLARTAPRSPAANLANALELTKEAVIRDFDAEEKQPRAGAARALRPGRPAGGRAHRRPGAHRAGAADRAPLGRAAAPPARPSYRAPVRRVWFGASSWPPSWRPRW